MYSSIVIAILLCRRIRIATRGCTSKAASSEPQVRRVSYTRIRRTPALVHRKSKRRPTARGSIGRPVRVVHRAVLGHDPVDLERGAGLGGRQRRRPGGAGSGGGQGGQAGGGQVGADGLDPAPPMVRSVLVPLTIAVAMESVPESELMRTPVLERAMPPDTVVVLLAVFRKAPALEMPVPPLVRLPPLPDIGPLTVVLPFAVVVSGALTT